MAKLKSGLLSLEAKGSLGDSLTFQSRNRGTMARVKPLPAQPQTLAQMYQRWLYQDYVAYWHDQTSVTKHLWETNARPYHMTGFAYWMRYHLTNLPDIAAGWRLDERGGSTAVDFSRNGNNGTIFGALHQLGYIDYALWFDGIDDRVTCGNASSLKDITLAITLECWGKPSSITGAAQWRRFMGKSPGWNIFQDQNNNGILLEIKVGGANKYVKIADTDITTWHHFVATFDSTLPSNEIKTYHDGVFANQATAAGTLDITTGDVLISGLGGRRLHGYVDHAVIYNRALTPSDIKRHSERRYPL